MARTQSRGGASLGQLYDVIGGRIGTGAELNEHEISLVHDLGAQVFVEGLRYQIRQITTSAINQSTAFDATATGLPALFKIAAITVVAGTANTLLDASVWLEEDGAGFGVILWHFDSATGRSPAIRTAAGTGVIFIPGADSASLMPNRDFIGRDKFVDNSNTRLAFRGTTAAFGAGTITFSVRILMPFWARLEQPAGALAPIPSW